MKKLVNLFYAYDEKTNFYSIMNNYVWKGDIKEVNDKHYFMAMIIRGGVFGEKSEESSK